MVLPIGSIGSMSGRQAGIVSCRAARMHRTTNFRGQKKEAPPLPMNQDFSPWQNALLGFCHLFGDDFPRTHRQAITRLSWLSYSPWTPYVHRRTLSKVRFRLSPDRSSPRRHTLNAPIEWAANPVGGFGRISIKQILPHRLCDMTAWAKRPRISASPLFRDLNSLSDRTSGLLYWDTRPAGLL